MVTQQLSAAEQLWIKTENFAVSCPSCDLLDSNLVESIESCAILIPYNFPCCQVERSLHPLIVWAENTLGRSARAWCHLHSRRVSKTINIMSTYQHHQQQLCAM